MAHRTGTQRLGTTTKAPQRGAVSGIVPYALSVLNWRRQIARVFERLPLILSGVDPRDSQTAAPQAHKVKLGRVVDIRLARIARAKRKQITREAE